MGTPLLSIIIPTHQRAETLRECLRRIEAQTIREQLEVIVVSDGLGDNVTAQVAKSTWHMPVTFVEIEKSQQGSARNRGVKEAKGTTVLFIGDDIFLEPDACELHLRAHSEYHPQSIAVLGFTTWDPSIEVNDVMRWLEASGWQFGYGKISAGVIDAAVQHSFTYTSHISVPREVARQWPFREDLKLYGWEDMEWGKRLALNKIPLVYEPRAKAWHHHVMTLEDSLRRMTTIGESAVIVERASTLKVAPRGWKRGVLSLVALLPTMRGKHTAAFLNGVSVNTTKA